MVNFLEYQFLLAKEGLYPVLGGLAFRDIFDQAPDDFPPRVVGENRAADRDGIAGAILADVLLLVGAEETGLVEHPHLVVFLILVFRRRNIPVGHRKELVPRIAGGAEHRLVGVAESSRLVLYQRDAYGRQIEEELVFAQQPFPRRDIAYDEQRLRRFARLILDQRPVYLHVEDGAILPEPPVLLGAQRSALHDEREVGDGPLPVIRHNEVGNRATKLVLPIAVSEHRECLAGKHLDPPLQIGNGDAVRRRFDDGPVPSLAFSYPVLKVPVRGNVLARAQDAVESARLVAKDRVVPQDEPLFPIPAKNAVLMGNQGSRVALFEPEQQGADFFPYILGQAGFYPVPADKLRRAIAKEPVPVFVEQRDGAGRIRSHDYLGRHVQKPLGVALAFLEVVCRLLALREVSANQDEARLIPRAGHPGDRYQTILPAPGQSAAGCLVDGGHDYPGYIRRKHLGNIPAYQFGNG